MKIKGILIAVIWTLLCPFTFAQKAPKRPNVLFIMVDDLRPELNCYGKTQIKSPNIDRLASRGVVFKNSFCNVPVCGASRASFLTGVRPAKNRFLVAKSMADEDLPGHLSLPRYLKQNGYSTFSLGKVYHNPADDIKAWSLKPSTVETASGGNYMNQDNIILAKKAEEGKRGPAFEIGEETNEFLYRDGLLAKKAMGVLDSLKDTENPFFLAVGFFKPHLPFVAPKKYFDLYKRDEIKLAPNQFVPEDAPSVAIINSGELRQYTGVPKDKILPDDYAISLRHAYFASISYVDAMIGAVLKKLEETGLAENTIVVLVGDHGWNLGEHTIWGKHNTFETALRAPLIITTPNLSKNKKSSSLAEFVDIYPTLTELCGLKVPEHCQGKSLVPVLEKPKVKVKNEIFAFWKGAECIHTEKFAYTEWQNPKTNTVTNRMLYDLTKDPNENTNVADRPEYQNIVAELSQKISESVKNR
ncbi:MAG TPA: sulfatase [Pelobium sp.]|nr:sulfatase [Pelobium sp.]